MKRIIKLTESDLTRIVRRVINEENESEKNDPCAKKIEELRNIPKYKRVREKIKEYNELEWWEWYDAFHLLPTLEEQKIYQEFLSKESNLIIDCYNKK